MRVRILLGLVALALSACELGDQGNEAVELSSQNVAMDAASGGGFALAPTVGGYSTFGATTMVGADGSVSFWNGVWNLPVPVDCGRAIGSLVVAVRDNGASNGHTSDGNIVTASLVLRSSSIESTLASAASAGTGLAQTLTLTVAAPHAMLAGESLVLRFTPTTVTTPPHFATFPSTAGVSQIVAAPIRVPVPINAPRTGPSPGFQGDAFSMSGSVQSAVFQITGIPIGSKLVGARVRVRDNAIGPTLLNAIIYPSTDGSQGSPIATSSTSSGSGAAQTLALSGMSAIVAPLTSYSIYVNTVAGSGLCSVLGIDVDYVPAP